MTDLETRLRTALHEEAASHTAPAGLADATAARGVRVRRRRRALAAAACVAVVAVAVPVLQGLTGSTTSVGPVSPRPSVNRAPHRSPAPTPVRQPRAWGAGLPDGAPPSVPYLRGMTYHWSPRPGRTSSYSVPDINTNVFGPVHGGVLVGLSGTAGRFHPEFGVAAPGGAFRRLGSGTAAGMAASPDGREVAVGNSSVHRIEVFDAATGARLSSLRAVDARVLSWGPGGVYYETGVFSGNEKLWAWSPGSVVGPRPAVAALNRYGVGLDLGHPGCARLVTPDRVSDCLPLPRSAMDLAVSRDARYVGYLAGGRTMWVAVLDVTTGRSHRLTPPLPYSALGAAPGNVVWEPSDELVFVLTSRTHHHEATQSLVRCEASGGRCEVALRDVTGRDDGFFPPLALTPPYSY